MERINLKNFIILIIFLLFLWIFLNFNLKFFVFFLFYKVPFAGEYRAFGLELTSKLFSVDFSGEFLLVIN
jgi:hypothetical protein